jgi:ribosomal protein L11 methyltransferase
VASFSWTGTQNHSIGCVRRQAPGDFTIGLMFSLEISCEAEERDFLIADLWEQGSAGIAELDERHLRAFFEDTVDRKALLQRYPGATARIEEQRDWVQAARDLLPPLTVGTRFFLVPEWRDDPTPPGRFRITINPGMAFGTGVHETTQLCLEALEEFVKPGMTVVDVGAGSGILARAAGLLQAERVYSCDIDPVAVRLAGAGFVGSADAIRSGIADVTVANISPEVIIHLGSDLLRTLRPRGLLLASGFEWHEVELVQAALPPTRDVRRKGNWALAIIEKSR